MQRIERYGVIALLLLLVTVLAVSMWGEETVGATDSSTHTLASVTPARREAVTRRQTPARTTRRNTPRQRGSQLENGAPLSSKVRPIKVQPHLMPANDTLARNSGSDNLRVGVRRNTITTPAGNNNRGFTPSNSGANRVKRPTRPAVIQPKESNPIQAAVDLVVKQTPRLTEKLKPVFGRKATPAKVKTWTVQSGETLSEISQEALGSASLWRKIAAANPGVDPNRLSVGTKLILPSGADVVASVKPAVSPAVNRVGTLKPRTVKRAGGTYTIQSGDVLSKIAQRELGSAKRWREIVSLNPSVDPNRLAVGMKLVLPAGGVARSSQPVDSNSLAVVRAKKPGVTRNRVR